MSKVKKVSVPTNLIRQNCYLRFTSEASSLDLKSGYSDSQYVSLDEKVTDKGLEIEYNSYPYPITPQYVNSFVDSADYRRDPLNAISNGVKRSNLGDVTSVQDISSMDTQEARVLYDQLSAKFSKNASASASVSASASASVSAPAAVNNGGHS